MNPVEDVVILGVFFDGQLLRMTVEPLPIGARTKRIET
jgi:hypothetical protein